MMTFEKREIIVLISADEEWNVVKTNAVQILRQVGIDEVKSQ